MTGSTITEAQGEKIISVLGNILWTLQEIDKQLSLIDLKVTNIDSELGLKD